MERNIGTTEWISSLIIGGAFVLLGFGFMVLGLTWLPVIGLVAGLLFFAMAYYIWTRLPARRNVNVLIGAAPFEEAPDTANARAQRVVPVTILSSVGEGPDFDASTIDISTVRFGPNLAKPIIAIEGAGTKAAYEYQKSPKSGGKPDLVLHFSLDEAGITRADADACITAQTTQGEVIRGCAPIREAA